MDGLFETFDPNGDGSIDFRELNKMLRQTTAAPEVRPLPHTRGENSPDPHTGGSTQPPIPTPMARVALGSAARPQGSLANHGHQRLGQIGGESRMVDP